MDAKAVKEKVSLVDYLEKSGVILRRGKAKCPFHNEKTASFTAQGHLWYCFGCGKGGDVITFVELRDGISFKDALEKLKQEYGLSNIPYKPKVNYHLEALKENYQSLKDILESERDELIDKYHDLKWLLNKEYTTGKLYNFEFFYHQRLDQIDESLRQLENAKYNA